MSTTRILIVVVLGGLLGPGLGITANVIHAPWLIVPAITFVFVGNFLIYNESRKRWAAKRREEQPKQ